MIRSTCKTTRRAGAPQRSGLCRVASGLALGALLSVATPAHAVDLANALVYQGNLSGSGASAVLGKTVGMKFELFDAATGGASLADWSFFSVPVDTRGNFRVSLAGGTKFDLRKIVHATQSLYLEISVQGATGLQKLTPRVEIGNTARALHSQHAENGAPVGTIVAFGGNTPPKGWLLCDGQAINRTKYTDLHKVIGTHFGSGDGSTTFNVPDLRGRFLRGVDLSGTLDKDAASRTAMTSGGNTGPKVGSVQGYATARPSSAFSTSSVNLSHSHSLSGWVYRQWHSTTSGHLGVLLNYSGATKTTSALGSHNHSVTAGGDKETRPVNAYVNYIIKS